VRPALRGRSAELASRRWNSTNHTKYPVIDTNTLLGGPSEDDPAEESGVLKVPNLDVPPSAR
jgi:hypothetical protein